MQRRSWLLVIAEVILVVGLAGLMSEAQNYTIIHNFTGTDGAQPQTGLTIDRGGHLYGTTRFGGYFDGECNALGCGTAFELSSNGSGWSLKSLHSFKWGNDGAFPASRIVFGPDGALYGTTLSGGNAQACYNDGCGTIYKLRPPATFCPNVSCLWTESVLYAFTGGTDGYSPYGDLIFDRENNFYGTTYQGGSKTACNRLGCGAVYQLSPSNGGWTLNVLHTFSGPDGAYPEAGLLMDTAGNLYGTTTLGGADGYGTAFELMAGEGWAQSILHQFDGADGDAPIGVLISNATGILYGTTAGGGPNSGGTVFALTPPGGGWNESVISSFEGGNGPLGPLVMDAAGNLYGTTQTSGAPYFQGMVFKLTPTSGGWVQTILHKFTGFPDGAGPQSGLVLDSSGNLYGTTVQGGSGGQGTIFEITP